MIHAAQLVKRFGQLVAVAGVDLDVAPGETLGLLGPNGAGKSTTIGMLVGLLAPDEGQARIGGLDPCTPAGRRLLGIAPQNLSLYEELTASENLRFFAQLYGLRADQLRQRIEWALDFAGLQERRNDRIRTFSGGMKRRLNLAVALLHEPQVLLLDEPTVGVDPQSRHHLFEKIESLAGQVTILYTTHYMEEAARLCDRVAIMDQGRVLALDTVSGLIAAHGGHSVVQVVCDRPPAGRWAELWQPNGHIELQSRTPLQEIAAMAADGLQFRSLHVSEPSLEQVFLNLTGRSLRDA